MGNVWPQGPRSRRAFLRGLGLAGAGVVVAAFGSAAIQAAPKVDNRSKGRGREKDHIVKENRKRGSKDWDTPDLRRSRPTPPPPDKRDSGPELDEPSLQPVPDAARAAAGREPASDEAELAIMAFVDTPIRGYASRASINRGQAINLHIGTTRPNYRLEVYRMGWYGGTGATLVTSAGPLPGSNPSVPQPSRTTGLLALSWPVSYTLQTGADWVTGVYLVKLISSANDVSYIPFVLRDDSLEAAILYQVPVTTWQAYNNWGGKSLYEYNSTSSRRAYKVSFDRPYANWGGAGDFFEGDYNMIRWLEAQGYSIAYSTSIDTHTSPAALNVCDVFLSNWHDEYWTRTMRDNLTAARNAGTHLAFFDSNNVYWQVRFESSSSGVANRIMACYKNATLDPTTNPSLETINWRDAPVNLPENALLGVMFEGQFQYGSSYPWVVQNADHWIYEGTGLANGQGIPGLIGYEYDKVWNNGQTPANLTILAASPVINSRTHNGTIYTAGSGALVFSAGTNYWPWKVDDNDYQQRGADSRVQRMTANLLNTMSGGPPPPPPPNTPPPTTPAYRDVVLADTPTNYWRLGETSGTTAADARGAQAGTYTGGPTLGQPGALTNDSNAAASFDGVNDYVLVPYSAALNPTAFSVEVWAYPTGRAGTYRGVVSNRGYPRGWVLYASGENVWSLWLNSGAGMISLDGPAIGLNAWTHLVGTFDGTTARLYVNGLPVASATISGYTVNNTAPLTIGQGEAGGNFWFAGRLDEVSLYSRALTAAQIQTHYNAGRNGPPPPPASLRSVEGTPVPASGAAVPPRSL